MEASDLKVNRTYRGKRRTKMGKDELGVFYNDRTIIWLGPTTLQYDGPAVTRGAHFPLISIERFLQWAHSEVEPAC